MTPLVSVVVPATGAPVLACSVGAALGQTVDALEVIVVTAPTVLSRGGAGPPPVVGELLATDARVRWVAATAPGAAGEMAPGAALDAAVDTALDAARAGVALHLAEGDLWLPDHAATVLELLDGADAAHTLPVEVTPAGGLRVGIGDLADPDLADAARDHEPLVPASTAGHTIGLRHRARARHPGVAWSAGLAELWADAVDLPGARVGTSPSPTALHFPPRSRRGWGADRRQEEVAAWARRVADPGWRAEELPALAHEGLVRAARRGEVRRRALDAAADELARRLEHTEASLAAERGRADGLAAAWRAADDARQQAEAALSTAHATRTWRARTRLVGVLRAGRSPRSARHNGERPTEGDQ